MRFPNMAGTRHIRRMSSTSSHVASLVVLLLPAAVALPQQRLGRPSVSKPLLRDLVLYESPDGWLVANKPRGMVVHDGSDSLVATLTTAGYADARPCHRLDAETSGVILMAQTSEVAAQLTGCLAAAGTIKHYRGIVKGTLQGSGTWKQSLSPKAEGRRNARGVAASRVPAATEFKVLDETPYLRAVDFPLRSGRTEPPFSCQIHGEISTLR